MSDAEYRDYDNQSRRAIAEIRPGKPSTYAGVSTTSPNQARFSMKSARFNIFLRPELLLSAV